jgi:conjugative transfer signal peptidase TraF
MTRLSRVGGGLAGIWLVGAGVVFSGARVNTSPSMPIGLYWATRTPLVRGATVSFCPPPGRIFELARERGYLGRGSCPGGDAFLIKRVAAAAGDRVRIAEDGIEVNGMVLAHSQPLPFDADGQPLPRVQLETRLEDSELLVIGDASVRSFDSRYFGLIPRAQVQAVLQPVLTW